MTDSEYQVAVVLSRIELNRDTNLEFAKSSEPAMSRGNLHTTISFLYPYLLKYLRTFLNGRPMYAQITHLAPPGGVREHTLWHDALV